MARSKGTNIILLVKFLRANRERALELLPASCHRYLEERVLPSSWYPVADHRELLRAVGAMLPPGGEPFVQMGRVSAQTDLGGIYRASLKPNDPYRSLAALPALWRNYQDTGEIAAQLESPTAVLVVLRGYPSFREFCGVTGGFVAELVAMTGVKEVAMEKLQCKVDGASDCRWRVSWAA